MDDVCCSCGGCEEGRKIIGFDFDSQEGVIFSIFGDVVSGLYNSSPAGAKILTGDKDHNPPSDIHSSIARKEGIPRNIAKGLFYQAEFGGSRKGCTNTVMSADRSKSKEEASEIAGKFLSALKGTMVEHKDRDKESHMYQGGEASKCFNVLMERGDAYIQKFPLTGHP